MKQKRAKIGFTGCAKAYIRSLQEEGRYSTAHVYKNAVLSFTRFHGSTYIAFEQITRESLRRYGQYLYDCKLKLNMEVGGVSRPSRKAWIYTRFKPLMCAIFKSA